jgi:hypothetical protein
MLTQIEMDNIKVLFAFRKNYGWDNVLYVH